MDRHLSNLRLHKACKVIRKHNQKHFIQLILDNPDQEWDWDELSLNSNITMDFADNLTNLNFPWDYSNLSSNPSITIEYVLNNPNLPWNYSNLSSNPNITIEHVLNNPNLPWSYVYLSSNPNITVDCILAYPDKPWDFNWVSGDIRTSHLLAHPDKTWNMFTIFLYLPLDQPESWNLINSFMDDLNHDDLLWNFLSMNPSITLENVSSKKYPWKWYFLSSSPGISLEDIFMNLDHPWSWKRVSANPNMSLSILGVFKELSSQKWSSKDLSANKLNGKIKKLRKLIK